MQTVGLKQNWKWIWPLLISIELLWPFALLSSLAKFNLQLHVHIYNLLEICGEASTLAPTLQTVVSGLFKVNISQGAARALDCLPLRSPHLYSWTYLMTYLKMQGSCFTHSHLQAEIIRECTSACGLFIASQATQILASIYLVLYNHKNQNI